jgi:hypothetical protein
MRPAGREFDTASLTGDLPVWWSSADRFEPEGERERGEGTKGWIKLYYEELYNVYCFRVFIVSCYELCPLSCPNWAPTSKTVNIWYGSGTGGCRVASHRKDCSYNTGVLFGVHWNSSTGGDVSSFCRWYPRLKGTVDLDQIYSKGITKVAVVSKVIVAVMCSEVIVVNQQWPLSLLL